MTSFDEQVHSAKVILPSKRITFISRSFNQLYPFVCSNVNHGVTSDKITPIKALDNDAETVRQTPKWEVAQRAIKRI